MKNQDKQSMEYWLPKLRKLDVKIPKTIMIDAEMFPDDSDGNVMIGYDREELEKAVKKLGFPVFLRTDHASAKHDLERISKAESMENIHGKIHMLADDNMSKGIMGVTYNSVAVREWINIKHKFKAFIGNLPIGYEMRVFIRDGEVECKHFYWVRGSIERTNYKPSDWKELLEETKEETWYNYLANTKPIVEKVADEFDGWWSVDLALTEDDGWYVIDMALGKHSYHSPSCEYSPMEE